MANMVQPKEFTDYVTERGYSSSPITNAQGAVDHGIDLKIVGYELHGPRGNKGFVAKEGDLIDLDAAALWCDGVDYTTRKVAERREDRQRRAERKRLAVETTPQKTEIDFDQERDGLDLDDPEDRAIFRQRVAHSLRLCTLDGLREHCRQRDLPSPASLADGIRLLANHEIIIQRYNQTPQP